MFHRVLTDLLSRLAQLLPVRHLANDARALGLNHIRGMTKILTQLRIGHRGSGRHRKSWRGGGIEWPRIKYRTSHTVAPSSPARISARCSVFTPVRWRCRAP